MSVLKPRVVVSNSNRMHAHHMARGLELASLLDSFITSLWYKPNHYPYRLLSLLPERLQHPARAFLQRRSMETLDAELVHQRWFIEVQRLCADAVTRGRYNEKLVLWHRERHDAAVARRIRKLRPDIFVGYEISCRDSMAQAKLHGAITILDLAGFHYRFSHALRDRFDRHRVDKPLLQKLADRKESELRLSDYIFCLSTLARDSLFDNGIDPDRVRLINLGADTSVFRPTGKSVSGKFTVLFVGMLSRQKGVHVLLEAFKRAKLVDAELVLVGPRGGDAIVCEFDGLFTRHSYMPHAELARQYQAADVFVLPSFVDSWGMVVNEAMASGTPVIVSENVGSKDIVNSENGFVVPVGDVDALAEKLRYCHAHRERMVEMGKAASEAVARLTWDNYYTSVANTIDEIWRSRGR